MQENSINVHHDPQSHDQSQQILPPTIPTNPQHVPHPIPKQTQRIEIMERPHQARVQPRKYRFVHRRITTRARILDSHHLLPLSASLPRDFEAVHAGEEAAVVAVAELDEAWGRRGGWRGGREVAGEDEEVPAHEGGFWWWEDGGRERGEGWDGWVFRLDFCWELAPICHIEIRKLASKPRLYHACTKRLP